MLGFLRALTPAAVYCLLLRPWIPCAVPAAGPPPPSSSSSSLRPAGMLPPPPAAPLAGLPAGGALEAAAASSPPRMPTVEHVAAAHARRGSGSAVIVPKGSRDLLVCPTLPPSSATPTRHRPLPVPAALMLSTAISLRPHQVPPPPPVVVPAGFSPRVVLLTPEPPHSKLRSMVVGDLSSMAVGVVVSEAQLEVTPALVAPPDSSEMGTLAPAAPDPSLPPVRSPPEFTQQELGMPEVEGDGPAWQVVPEKKCMP